MRLLRSGFAGLCLIVTGCTAADSRGSSPAFITDAWGREVAAGVPARRIVSLAPATTELVFALGAGDRLVGRTTWCDWPAEASAVPDVGNGLGPNVEAVAAQRPDLVLVYPSEANRAAVGQLEALGIRSAVLRQDAIADWRETVRLVGALTGTAARAESLLAGFESGLAGARPPITADSPTVFIAVGVNPPIAIGAGSFVSELVTLAGGRNVFADLPAPSAVVSLEAIVARDPDLVVVLGPDSAAGTVARRQGWGAIRAVRAGRIVTLDGSMFDRPSPRLPEAVLALTRRFAPVASPR